MYGVIQSVSAILTFLDTLEGWIEDIPPLRSPQRFGNLAFRTWGIRLEEVSHLPSVFAFLIRSL